MVTTLPRVHIAVMGVEKVVPSMTDLMVFLAILAKSATGQKGLLILKGRRVLSFPPAVYP